MAEFKPTFSQFKEDGNGSFVDLLKRDNPLAIFFICPQNVDRESLNMAVLVERIAARYGGQLRFFWIDSNTDRNLCQKLGLNGVPVLILFHKGKEIALFTCATSEPGICYNLDELLKPEKHSDLRYMRRMIPIII